MPLNATVEVDMSIETTCPQKPCDTKRKKTSAYKIRSNTAGKLVGAEIVRAERGLIEAIAEMGSVKLAGVLRVEGADTSILSRSGRVDRLRWVLSASWGRCGQVQKASSFSVYIQLDAHRSVYSWYGNETGVPLFGRSEQATSGWGFPTLKL
jgi:hypothetical protein